MSLVRLSNSERVRAARRSARRAEANLRAQWTLAGKPHG